jgi:hypothetical protein
MSVFAHEPGAPRSPFVPLSACLALAGVAAAIGGDAGLTGAALLEAPLSLAVLGIVLAIGHAVRGTRAREEANDWIRRGYESRFRWRVAELTSRRERKAAARSLRALLRELEFGAPLGPVPINRRAVRANRALVAALAERLLDPRPVTAAGMVAVENLLTLPESPLFPRHLDTDPDPAREAGSLRRALAAAIDELEVR